MILSVCSTKDPRAGASVRVAGGSTRLLNDDLNVSRMIISIVYSTKHSCEVNNHVTSGSDIVPDDDTQLFISQNQPLLCGNKLELNEDQKTFLVNKC